MKQTQLNIRISEDFRVSLKKKAIDARLSLEKFVLSLIERGLVIETKKRQNHD